MSQNMLPEKACNVYKQLKGIVCLYKPPDVSVQYLIRRFGEKVCFELNNLKVRPPMNYLGIEETESGKFILDIRPSYSDNVLAAGPRYSDENIFLRLSSIGKRTSGVCLIGINKGISFVEKWKRNNPLKVFQIKGMLGEGTQYFYKNERVVARAKYGRVQKATMDKVLSSFQAAHQRKIYADLQVDIQSQKAYEIAVSGMLRPPVGGIPCIYSIKCVNFESPYFTIEISCVNDNENYILRLVHDLGLQLKTFAHCTGIRCIRLGPFTVKNAMIISQLSLSNLLQNMKECKELTEKYNTTAYSPFLRSSSESVPYKHAEER